MWVPVLESAKLGHAPVRVQYWGTPVVLFRTVSGQLGALEDLCAHRGVALSCGAVCGDTIRCGFHHFQFGVDGACTNVPDVFKTNADFKLACRVRRFFARECVGLIWISIEEEPQAAFPVDASELSPGYVAAAGSFEVEGDIRVWMDHFLDIAHCIWTHAETTYAGSAERPAQLESMDINVDPNGDYPVRRAIEMDFRILDENRTMSYTFLIKMFFRLTQWKRSLMRSRKKRDFRLHVRADLVTPLCQETRTRFGGIDIRVWTGLVPHAPGRNLFVYAAVADVQKTGKLGSWLTRRLLADFVEQHLRVEDGRFLAHAQFVRDARFQATPMDVTVQAMRTLFQAYQLKKGHLYPEDSLIRTLDYR